MATALKQERGYILWIILFYVLSQGLILFVSGMWYDDWAIVNLSSEGLKKWALEMGRPEVYPIFSFIISVPEIIYKVIIFVGYLVTTISFFMLSQKCLPLETADAFRLTLIYLCIPVNDIRIERLGMPYTLGMTLFFIAFCYFAYKYDNLTVLDRGIILCLFFVSYILNSLLVYMGLVWIYIVFKERDIKKILRKIDFFIIPVLFFLLDQIFFPAHGVYDGYNSVSFAKLPASFIDTLKAESNIISQIISVFLEALVRFPTIIPFVFTVLCITYWIRKNRKRIIDNNKYEQCPLKEIVVEAVIGFIALFASLFPYVVVGNTITISGFDSRNVILAPFGIAFMIHAFFRIGLRKEIVIIVTLLMLGMSSIYFHRQYAVYQRIYYSDRGLQVHLMKNSELKNCKNIAVLEGDGGASWYMYNGMFEEVYGDESRLVENMNYTKVMDPKGYSACIDREWYNMSECDISYTKVDCVLLYSNNMSLRKALTIRIREMLGEDINDLLIEDSSFKIIYPNDDEFYNYVER